MLATAVAVNTLVGSLGMQHYAYAAEIMGIRLSNAVKGLVYRKVSTSRVTDSFQAFSIMCTAFTWGKRKEEKALSLFPLCRTCPC